MEYAAVLGVVVLVAVAVLSSLGSETSDALAVGGDALQKSPPSQATEPEPEDEPTLHVGGIELTVEERGRPKAAGQVQVLDQDGQPVRRASVSVGWFVNGTHQGTSSGRTGRGGTASVTFKDKDLEHGDVVKLVIGSVSASGYEYDADHNAESEKEARVP